MEFMPLTLYFLLTSSRVLFPIFTLKNLSNFLTPPNTTRTFQWEVFFKLNHSTKSTCTSKKASPTVCSYFRHLAVSHLFLRTNNTLIILYFNIWVWGCLKMYSGKCPTYQKVESYCRSFLINTFSLWWFEYFLCSLGIFLQYSLICFCISLFSCLFLARKFGSVLSSKKLADILLFQFYFITIILLDFLIIKMQKKNCHDKSAK